MQLTPLVMNARNGEAIDEVARRFNLSREQTEAAVEALMPAFAAGIARQTREPAGAASFVRALGSGRHAGYVDEPAALFTPDGQSEGVGILGHLFGRKDVSREVAARAAERSGLSEGLLKKLLPVLAPIVMGALVKGLAGANKRGGSLGRTIEDAAGGGLLGTILGSLAEGMASGAGGRRVPTSRRRRTARRGRRGGLEDLLGGLMNGGLDGLFNDVGGGTRRAAAAPRTRRATRRTRPAPIGKPGSVFAQLRGEGPARRGGGLFGALADPGGSADPAYRREVGNVFDRLLD